MRYFYYDKKNNVPVLVALPCQFTGNTRFVQVFENESPFYIETWRDKTGRREMKFASFQKPNTEFANRGREQAARKNNFVCYHLIALDIPTKEFEAMIEDFGIIPIIV